MQKRHILLILLFFLRVFQIQAQTENYPVSATLVFAAPFSLKVSDYFTSNTRMYLNLNLKDLTKPTLKVYLKWSLEGPGIRISTREGFIPTSFIELSKGTVSLQRGSDLGLYFQRGMLDYQGIDEGVVFNGSMPEGFYTMKFQALEAGSGREVSNLAESFFFVTSPQPPIINQPFNGSTVAVTNPQNVLLQWTPRQISTLESQVVYEVTIYEVADGDDPIVVANSGILPKFNRTVTTTSTFMGASDLPLQEGKRYAMVVTAKDLNGKMNFENGGKSEVSWFQYGKGCFAPTGLNVAETAPGKVILSWTPNTTAEGYVVEYKKKPETTWIVNGSLDNSYTLNGLSPKTEYEFRVKTQCSGGKYSAYTVTESVSVIGLVTPTPETEVSLEDVLDPFSQTVSTKSDGKPFDPKNIEALFALLKPPACAVSGVSYVCGQTPNATPPVGIDLTELAKGDVLGIYDYAVLVTEVSKGSSPFTGKGLVKLPFAGGIKVPVEFKGIKAKKGEDGTQGGCVWYVPSDLSEGYFQVKGSKQDAIVKEQEKLLADIYSELIDPQSFYGTFEEALAKYEAKRKEIQAIEDAGGKASKEDYQELTKYLRGIVQGGNDWKEKLLKYFGSDASKPENKAILDKLDALKAALLACEKCVADNLATTPPKTGGGGPMGFEDWEVNLAKCVYPDAQKEMGDIKISIANNACGPESILACVGAAAMDIALNYAFKWVEVNFLDENNQNNYAITDFDNIWKAQDKYEVFSSAAIACAVALVPFPTGTTKEKILATAVGAFAGGAVALITDAGDQYEVLPVTMSVGDKLSSIDWKQSFRKAGTSAFITGVSSGIALWAIDHPRFRTFGAKVKSIGYDKIKVLLKKSDLSEETIEAFCRRFGIGFLLRPRPNVVAELVPTPHLDGNDLNCVRDQSLYEIIVNGKTWKFGLADNTNWNKTENMPQRLWEQIRRLRRDNPTWTVNGNVVESYKNALRKDMRRLEDWFVDKYRASNKNLFPPDNQNHQYLKE